MKKWIPFKGLLILLAFITLQTKAQIPQPMGEHMAEELLYGRREKLPSRFDIHGKGIIPLQHRKQTKSLSKIVFGFMPDWEYTNDANADMHYDLLTHVAAFAFVTSSSGNITNPSAWPWTDVINAAHTKGTKVIMAVTNFGGSEKASAVAHNLVTDAGARDNLFRNIKNIITTYQLDGVNIDFEAMNSDDRGTLLNQFMSALTQYIHTNLPGKEVSFDGPAVNWGGWDMNGLAQSVDYIFIMGYDYYGSWSNTSGPVAPLTSNNGGHCIEYDLTHTYSLPLKNYPQKLILGVPYYGKHWETSTGEAYAAVTSYISTPRYRDAAVSAPNYGGFLWDYASSTPWYKWESSGTWNQVWIDNDKSLGKKYDYALSQNLGGVGIWALNYDGSRQELWELIRTKFGGSVLPSPSRPQSPAALIKDSTSVTLLFRPGNYSEKYNIYESTDNENYTKVGETTDTLFNVSGLTTDSVYYFKISSVNASGESAMTKVLAAMPGRNTRKFLIVDGVERRSFDAITQYKYPMTQLKYDFSEASNEAVEDGVVNLKNFKFIIWMLLDESTADDTFNKTEQARVADFIDNDQGVFIVSGSEVGWDLVEKGDATDKAFYEKYFKAKYIADKPGDGYQEYTAEDNNQFIYHFDDGTHGITKIGYPDLIQPLNGSKESFTYPGIAPSTGVAGVSYKTDNGGIEYLAFPIEAVYNNNEREKLLTYILSKYNDLLPVEENPVQTQLRIYPNPAHDQIILSNPEHLNLKKVEIFDLYGRKQEIQTENNRINIGLLPKGLYIIRITDKKGHQGSFKIIKQ
ncbi:T9SS type A sorting domain-containing protein [Candidatus Sulfidibacterium hydrothermale]|uniref:glycosyl hydrolase family 18 protein n=1 Tax=Candidatus Sulfidibacterium hydrothermale TaxID=2875962 RepID=UPI001F0B2F05|nr:glycosyl hydrolase family 18 protein [Candidatus Sulfidibacterium hydrothermale]UBM61819.1 T9SS type A sorting domain-containing protein [Candidatus Sulfidibacterium hydrothermale]